MLDELVTEWRGMGPVRWAEGPFGWIGADGQPIRLEPWQRAALSAWWEWREQVSALAISSIKKTGKTLLNAVLLAWRWLALPGEHFAAGNDLDQSAGRQFSMIAEMVKRHDFLRRNCDVGKKLITFRPTGSTIAALAVDAAGNAGANHTSASHTEAWGLMYESGRRAWEELTPPPGRFYGLPALRIVDSYAGFEGKGDGASETWHTLVDRGLAGERLPGEWPVFLAGGLLLLHLGGEEAQARCFRGTPEEARAYYDDQRATLRDGAYRRQHLNERVSGAEAFITGEQWDGCADPALTPLPPSKDAPLFVGVDLAVKGDDAAVVALGGDGPHRARVAWHRVWHTSKAAPLNLEAVANYLRAQAQAYRLAGVYFDPSQAQLLAAQLRRDGLPMLEVPQTLGELGPRGTALFEAIRDGRLRAYPSDELRQAAMNASAKEVSTGLHLVNTSGRRKIDAIVALSFALPAALEGFTPLPESQPAQASRWRGVGEESRDREWEPGWAKRY